MGTTETTATVTPFEDRERGVWFLPPSEDFEVLTGSDALAFGPYVVVALRNGPKCSGFVTVEPAAGRSAEQAAAAVRGGFDLKDVRIVEDEALLYCDKTGWRVEAWGTNAAGDPAARRATYLVQGDRLYGVFAHGDGTIHTRMRRCLDSITAGFELLGTD